MKKCISWADKINYVYVKSFEYFQLFFVKNLWVQDRHKYVALIYKIHRIIKKNNKIKQTKKNQPTQYVMR